MQNRVADFQRVSLEQYITDRANGLVDGESEEFNELSEELENIKLPERSTMGSAGYDFTSPYDFTLEPGESIVVKTGIRCYMDQEYVLVIAPRSSIGFKYGVQLANTVGIIDSDYYSSTNEGHIMLKFVNNGDRTFEVQAGDKIAQGIFLPFGITYADDVRERRNGGIGSTGR